MEQLIRTLCIFSYGHKLVPAGVDVVAQRVEVGDGGGRVVVVDCNLRLLDVVHGIVQVRDAVAELSWRGFGLRVLVVRRLLQRVLDPRLDGGDGMLEGHAVVEGFCVWVYGLDRGDAEVGEFGLAACFFEGERHPGGGGRGFVRGVGGDGGGVEEGGGEGEEEEEG